MYLLHLTSLIHPVLSYTLSVRYHHSRRLRLVSIDSERLRFSPKDRDRGLEEYRLRAAERDVEREREREREASESLDRDLLRPRFAPLERERLRLRLLLVELESESESESEEEEVLSESESESELDDLYEARTCQNFAQIGYIQTVHTWTASSLCPYSQSPAAHFPSSPLVRVRAPCL